MSKYIKRNSRVPEMLSFFFPVSAITIGPYIFIRKGRDTIMLVNHEGIHAEQGREMGYLRFWAYYAWYWLKELRKCRNFHVAYMRIPFEKEAYANQHDLDYLANREPMSWRKYLTS